MGVGVQARREAGRSGVAPSTVVLGEWLDTWLSRHDGAPRTIEAYEGLFRLHVKPVLGSVPLADLTREEIDGFLRTLKLAHHTKTTVKSLIKKSLADAVDEGLIATSPAATLKKLPRDRNAERAKAEREMWSYLWSVDEWRLFLKAAERSPFLPVFKLLLATGARLGEVMALHWSDVDLDAGIVSITKSRGSAGIGLTKTGKARRVSIDTATVEMLRGLHRTGELVFPLQPGAATNAFVRLVKESGLRHMRLHDLRHLHATTLLSNGVPVTVVSKRLGHASTRMTLDTYSHVIPGQDEAAADTMAAAFA